MELGGGVEEELGVGRSTKRKNLDRDGEKLEKNRDEEKTSILRCIPSIPSYKSFQLSWRVKVS